MSTEANRFACRLALCTLLARYAETASDEDLLDVIEEWTRLELPPCNEESEAPREDEERRVTPSTMPASRFCPITHRWAIRLFGTYIWPAIAVRGTEDDQRAYLSEYKRLTRPPKHLRRKPVRKPSDTGAP